MKKLITLLLATSILVCATDIHRDILTIEDSYIPVPSGILKQDEVFAIDFGTIFKCQEDLSQKNNQLSQELIQKGLTECDLLNSITENKEQRNIDQGKMKVCLKRLFQNQESQEYKAFYSYVDCIVKDTVDKYNIDQVSNSAQVSSDSQQIAKGFQQIQDECSSQLFRFDDENVIEFFGELDANCLSEKNDVYVRMRVLEDAEKQFNKLLNCVDQIQSNNIEGKKLIRNYITCQQENFIPQTKKISAEQGHPCGSQGSGASCVY